MERLVWAVVIGLFIAGFMIAPSVIKDYGPITFGATPTWEYLIISPDDSNFTREMNKYGNEGWEMVFARRATDAAEYSKKVSYEVIMKRRKIGK